MKKIFLTLLLMSCASQAQARIYIPVNQASDQKFPIAVTDMRGQGRFNEDIAAIIRNDLSISGYFEVTPNSLYHDHDQSEGITAESIRFSFWSNLGAQALVKGSVEKGDKYTVNLRLFDPASAEMLVGKEYRVDKNGLRSAAHQFANEIMLALTGIRGVFDTQITYTALGKKHYKNIALMDMDGERNHNVTNYKNSSFSSSWCGADKLVFTSYLHTQPDIYTISTSGRNLEQLTDGPGSKITPTCSPDGQHIVFSSTISGEADLYNLPTGGRKATRIVKALGIDLNPSFSPDGSEIVYASEMSGNLHLFKVPASGGTAQRLTYIGYQNDMPNWSPMADKIVFAGRDMGTFDIFIMNPDGSNIQRLTIRSGSNEHPSFSPDGRFIVFSSTRDGESAIYMMRADGTNQVRISKGNGMMPEWGPQAKEE